MSEIANTPEAFFNAKTVATRYLTEEFPEIGSVCFRSLTDKEWTKIQSSVMKKEGSVDRALAQLLNARILVETIVDPVTKNKVFTDSDIPKFRDMDAGLVAKLAAIARKHLGIEDDEDEIKNG